MRAGSFGCCYECEDRHVGCHSNCKKYIDEKKRYDEDMKRYKQNVSPVIFKGSFLGDSGHNRKWKRREKENY